MTETIAKGHRAATELRETEAAFTVVRAAMLEEIAGSGFDQQTKRERLYMAVQSLDGVKKVLQSAVNAGLVEESVEQTRKLLAEHTTLLA